MSKDWEDKQFGYLREQESKGINKILYVNILIQIVIQWMKRSHGHRHYTSFKHCDVSLGTIHKYSAGKQPHSHELCSLPLSKL